MNNEYKKIAVVTSASTPLGFSLVSKLIREGFYVFGLTGADNRANTNIQGLAKMDGVKLFPGCVEDISDWEKIAEIVYNTCDELDLNPKVDLLISNPSLFNISDLEHLDEYELDLVLREGLFGSFNGVKYLMPLLEASRDSKVINIYPHSRKPHINCLANSITAASLDMLTQFTAQELRKYGISVNSICPLYDSIPIETNNFTGITSTLNTVKHLMDFNDKELTGQIFFVDEETCMTINRQITSEVLNV